ncbi:MAG: NTP transferase domain-containing protein [Gemmatimonadetes bacterium]|nr:NTP transferase domain-containing protein [Gemmatimonadota bacterium]NIO32292.1 NTP transferase domain-containing protein [Gemmatimonadota bacterium]
MIAGIVLAGGRSQRMGRPKGTLKVGEETFLERAVRVLREGGCGDIVVVLGVDAPQLPGLTMGSGVRATKGGEGPEQIDSLRAGLRALPATAEAAVVIPVDHPLIEPNTVTTIIETFEACRAPVVRVFHGGRGGHPVLFAANVFDELLSSELPEGARTVIRAHDGDLVEVDVDDPGVLIDINTPADYEEHLGELD